MALTSKTQDTRTGPEQAAEKIRELMAATLDHAEVTLQQIRSLVRKYTRAALAEELGDEAAAMLSVYSDLRNAVQTGKNIIVEDVPA